MNESARAVAATARWGLRAHGGTAVLLALGGAIMVAAVLPAAALGRGVGLAVHLSGPADGLGQGGIVARSPEWLRAEGIRLLSATLLGVAASAFAVGAFGLLLGWAARGSTRVGELAARRSVGASHRILRAAWVAEGLAVAGGALLIGLPLGVRLTAIAVAGWPGPAVGASVGAGAAVVAGAAAVIVVGAVVALVFLPRRRLVDADSRPLGLAIPVLQLGVALVVLTGGALLSRSAQRRTAPSATRDATVFRAVSATAEAAVRAGKYAGLLEGLRRGGGYDTVSLTAPGALAGLGTVGIITTECGVCPYGGLLLPQHSVVASQQFVSADSFQALGLRLVEGRAIADSDDWRAARVAVVSRTLARLHFQNGEPIGRRLLLGDDPRTWYTVVGVVDPAPATGLGAALLPPFTVYASVLQHPPKSVELTLRARSGTARRSSPVPVISRSLGVDPWHVARTTPAALLEADGAPVAWFGRLFALEGWAALVLAAAATTLQMWLWVRSLEPELGVRRALGARRRALLLLVVRRAALVGAFGLASGLVLGPAAWSALGALVSGLPGWDVALVARYGALLVSVSTLAALWPAWRAVGKPPAALLAAG